MKKALIAPSKYIQGEGELFNLAQYVEAYGAERVLMVSHEQDIARVQDKVDSSFQRSKLEYTYGGFNGECCMKEVDRLVAIAREKNCDTIIGLGGGKSLDTAKTVAHFVGANAICAPTIASTDAPCSSSAVIYTEDGVFDHYIQFKKNPDIVLADTSIIAKAPVRLLVAGMGDALSTFFEARACFRSNADNNASAKGTKAAMAIAELCFDTLMEDSLKAKVACEAKVVTQAFENIVEANTLLSGLGFESGGLAAAHAIHNGLTALDETHRYYHGEKVAFGTLTQLILENAEQQEIDQVLDYCELVNLPITLKQLGVESLDQNRLMKVAKLACAEGETIHNMPFEVTPEQVAAAILTADRLGADARDEKPVALQEAVAA